MKVRFWGGPCCGETGNFLDNFTSREVYAPWIIQTIDEDGTEKPFRQKDILIGTYVREDLLPLSESPPPSRVSNETRFIYRDKGDTDE